MNVNRDKMSEETRKLYDELRAVEEVSELLEKFEIAKTWTEAHDTFEGMYKDREPLGIPSILKRNRASLCTLGSEASIDWAKEYMIAYVECDATDIGAKGAYHYSILADIYPQSERDASDWMLDEVFEKDDVTIGDVKNLTSYIIGLRAQGYFLKEKCDEVLYRPLLDSITNSYDRPFPELPMDETTTPEVREKYLKLVGVLESIDGSELFDKRDSSFEDAGYWSGIFGTGPLGGN